jgi:hypothetical protein
MKILVGFSWSIPQPATTDLSLRLLPEAILAVKTGILKHDNEVRNGKK